jgi:hypothetical protein
MLKRENEGSDGDERSLSPRFNFASQGTPQMADNSVGAAGFRKKGKIMLSQAYISVPVGTPTDLTEALLGIAQDRRPPPSQLLAAGLRQGIPLNNFSEHSEVVRTYNVNEQEPLDATMQNLSMSSGAGYRK